MLPTKVVLVQNLTNRPALPATMGSSRKETEMTWPPPSGDPPPAYPAAPRRTNSLATASLVVALIGFGTGIAAPIGAILGHAARAQIRRTGEDGDAFAVAAIVIGWSITGLGLLACCVIGAVLLVHGARY